MKQCNHAPLEVADLDLPPVMGRWPGSCFVCSEGHPHGLGLRFYHTDDGVLSLCTIPNSYCGFDGMVHGGIISSLMDEAAAYALFARHGKLGVTREITVRFLKPVPTETQVRVEGRIVRYEPPEAEVEMAIYDVAGQRLAEGRTSWAFPRLSRIAALAGVKEEVLENFLQDCMLKDQPTGATDE